jgi:hypothetical protein
MGWDTEPLPMPLTVVVTVSTYDATEPRPDVPAAAVVYWLGGSLFPVNAQPGDLWLTD